MTRNGQEERAKRRTITEEDNKWARREGELEGKDERTPIQKGNIENGNEEGLA